MTVLILAKCVDRYIAQQIHRHDGSAASRKNDDEAMREHDDRLEAVVNRMFQRCIEEKEYTQVPPPPYPVT
jgi:26S proteasome subunit RPN2, N-terminal domain